MRPRPRPRPRRTLTDSVGGLTLRPMNEPILSPTAAPQDDPVEALATMLRELRGLPPLHPRVVREAAVTAAEKALEDVRCKIKIDSTRVPAWIVAALPAMKIAADEKVTNDIANTLNLPRDRVQCDSVIEGLKTDRVIVRLTGAEPQELYFDGASWEPVDFESFARAELACREMIRREGQAHVRRATLLLAALMVLLVVSVALLADRGWSLGAFAVCTAAGVLAAVVHKIVAAQLEAEAQAVVSASYMRRPAPKEAA